MGGSHGHWIALRSFASGIRSLLDPFSFPALCPASGHHVVVRIVPGVERTTLFQSSPATSDSRDNPTVSRGIWPGGAAVRFVMWWVSRFGESSIFLSGTSWKFQTEGSSGPKTLKGSQGLLFPAPQMWYLLRAALQIGGHPPPNCQMRSSHLSLALPDTTPRIGWSSVDRFETQL